MKFKLSTLTVMMVTTTIMTGCFNSGPKNLTVDLGDSATRSLLGSIPPSNFNVYFLDNHTFQEISDIYMDKLLVEKSLSSPDIRIIEKYIPTLNSGALRGYYNENLNTFMQSFHYEQAIMSFNVGLRELQKELEVAQANVDKQSKIIDQYTAILTRERLAREDIEDEIEDSKLKLRSLENELSKEVDDYNFEHKKKIRFGDVSFASHDTFTSIKGACKRFTKGYTFTIKKGNYCFSKKLPKSLNLTRNELDRYKAGFTQYIDNRFMLTKSHPALIGSYVDKKDRLRQRTRVEISNYEDVYGSKKDIYEKSALYENTLRQNRYTVEHYIRNKTKFIEEYLGKDFVKIKTKISYGIDLSDPNSPLSRDVKSSLSNIHPVTLDSQFQVDFDSNSSMAVIIVDSKGQEGFPMFMQPEVIDQETIGKLDSLTYSLNSNNLESVSSNGSYDTFITLVGESFIRWKD